MKQAQVLTDKDMKRVMTNIARKPFGADRNAVFGAEFELVDELLRGFDCYSKVAGFEAAIDVFPIYPNACLVGAFALKDDSVVVNLR